MAVEIWMYQAEGFKQGKLACLLILLRAGDADEAEKKCLDLALELNLVQTEATLGRVAEKPFVSSAMMDKVLRQLETEGIGYHLQMME